MTAIQAGGTITSKDHRSFHPGGSTGYQSPGGHEKRGTTVDDNTASGGRKGEREGEKRGGRGGEGGWTGSAACTWQSKEAINHEDNASSPLSEPRSLGVEGCLGRKRRTKEESTEDKQKEYERGPGNVAKVQAKSKPTTVALSPPSPID